MHREHSKIYKLKKILTDTSTENIENSNMTDDKSPVIRPFVF